MLVNRIELLALDIDGVITDGKVSVGSQGQETKGIAFRDLDALGKARREGIRIALVTGESGPLVNAIAERVGAEFVLCGAKDKVRALRTLSEDSEIDFSAMCFVGDADRDALAFFLVGLSLCPSDASPAARGKANRVLHAKGGEGAVAEAVEIVLHSRAVQERMPGHERALKRIVEDSIRAHERLLAESLTGLCEIAEVLAGALRTGHKVLLCGNGGSAADAQHVAAELVGRFAIEREPWPALALTTDTSILTAVGNDWDFKDVFARQVRAHARAGDIVVGISTSGRSPNVVRALEAATERGSITIAFTGRNGGPIAKAAQFSFKAPEAATPRVQELHILAWHGICEIVEAALVAERAPGLAETGS